MEPTKFVFLVAATIFFFGQLALAQIPQTMSYQGILTDAQGNAVADGSYSLTFNLYESATGGSSIWGETQDIEVVNGLFNAILGSVKPLSNSFDRPYWLGIAIGDDPELEPRIELTASAYSLNARSIADSAITSGKIADGQVVRVLQISPINGFTASLKDTVHLMAGANITFDAGVGPNGGLVISISATSSNNAGDSHSLDAQDGDPVDAVFVDNNGNVGIGTTTPAQQLDLTGNLQLPQTSVSAGDSVGIIMIDGKPFIHNFGTDNFFAGVNAGNLTMTGGANTASGVNAFSSNTRGNNNTASGESALSSNTSGNANMASGRGALFSNTTGSFNMASGRNALINNTTGSNNTASGRRALNSNTTGSNNTAIGSNADVSVGNLTNATAIGANAVVDAGNKIRLGDDNLTVVETNAMFHSLSGGFKFPDGTVQTTTSPWQTVGLDIFFEKGNIAIGTDASSNIVTVVKGSTTDPIADAWTVYSSRRWKTNIETIEHPLETVQALRGVTYDWKESGKHDIGLIAEEVSEVIPEIVAYEENGIDARSVDYARLVAVLIEAVKELSAKVERLEKASEPKLTHNK